MLQIILQKGLMLKDCNLVSGIGNASLMSTSLYVFVKVFKGMYKAKHIEYPTLKTSPLKHVKRGWDTKIPQSSGPRVKVGDEAVHKELGDRMERAATTASSLEAEQDIRVNINRPI
ncbi:hypothetical protein Tco_0444842 [Tanacetum coccineum]